MDLKGFFLKNFLSKEISAQGVIAYMRKYFFGSICEAVNARGDFIIYKFQDNMSRPIK